MNKPYLPYCGIGSRETPEEVQNAMSIFGKWMEINGFTLRSGGAGGADLAFERFVTKKEIYIPWRGFNNNQNGIIGFKNQQAENLASAIAANTHPAWHRCSNGAKKLHTRNVAQILGYDCLSPSKMVICWTKDGKASGGTGQAIRLAEQLGIPVYNLQTGLGDNLINIYNHVREINDAAT